FNLGVLVPPGCFILQNQVSAHTSAGKFFYSIIVLCAVGMSVEMARPVVPDVLEEFDKPECGARIIRAEPEVLIVAAGELVVQVNVEELAGFPGLGHSVSHVQA